MKKFFLLTLLLMTFLKQNASFAQNPIITSTVNQFEQSNNTYNRNKEHLLPNDHLPKPTPIPAPSKSAQPSSPIHQATKDSSSTKVVEVLPKALVDKVSPSNEVSLLEYKEKEKKFVDNFLNIDYRIQSPPKKLYDRAPTDYNNHLPPVYFKSYYLYLAFEAAKHDNHNEINAVLSRYDFINGQNVDGDTVLMTAIQYDSINIARLLLAKGAYVNATNHRKRTALHYAATLGNIEMVKLLLSMGADYTLTDDKGLTALDYAEATEKHQAAYIIDQYIRAQ